MRCAAGLVDAVSWPGAARPEIVEFKKATGHGLKAAVGQLLAYGPHFTGHALRLVLFGTPSRDFAAQAVKLCDVHGIALTFVADLDDAEKAELRAAMKSGPLVRAERIAAMG